MGSLQLCTPVGSVPNFTNYYINMNKFLPVFCLAAAANAAPKADADPYLLYGGYNGLGYAGYGGLYGGYLGYAAAPLWLPLELPPSLPLPLSTLPALPLPPLPLLLEVTLLLDVMLPTLLELSTLPRGRLRLMPR